MSVRFAWVACVALAAAARADERPAPEMLPTPYTWEQIRDVWQPGYATELRSVEGEVATRQRFTVLAATADTVTIRLEVFGADGAPSGAPQDAEARWTELRDHAAFPAALATRERADCHSPLGTQPGWRYIVRRPDEETAMFCFADATPGPPVELERRRGGVLVSRMERTSNERARGAKGEP